MIRALTTYLEGKVPGYKLGTNLFTGSWPVDAPDNAVLICKSTGAPTDSDVINERTLFVQIRARAASHFAAEEACDLFFNTLIARSNVGVALTRKGLSWWLHGPSDGLDPQYLGQDALGRFEYSSRVTLKLRKQ